MKKIYSLFAAVIVAATINAQAFTATYNFDAAPAPDNGTVTGSNITVSPFTAVGLTSTTTGNRFAWTNFPVTATPDMGKYFEVTLTPAADYKMTVTSITFRVQRSGTGPRTYAVRSSVDTYAANKPAAINNANPQLEIIPTNQFHFVNDGITMGQDGSSIVPIKIIDIAAPVTLRFYAYEAEAVTGTFSIDDVVFTGEVNSTLAVGDVNTMKNTLVKNTNVGNTIVFGAKANVQIINVNGQVVKTANVVENTSLDVSSLTKGMYIVSGEVNGERVSQKIIKK